MLVYLGAIIRGRLLLFLNFIVFVRFMSFRVEVSLLWRLWNDQELFDDVVDILLSLDSVNEEILVIRVIFVWIHHVLLLVCIVTYHFNVSIIIVIVFIFYRLNNFFLIFNVFFALKWSDLIGWCDLTYVLTHHDLLNATFLSLGIELIAFRDIHHSAR